MTEWRSEKSIRMEQEFADHLATCDTPKGEICDWTFE